jgi:hypothetical protein
MNSETKTKILKIGFGCAFVVILLIVIYAVFLIAMNYPISDLSIAKAGTFGDSFGVLTCLFSGLSSVGMIVAILMQREELELQREELQKNREEFEKSAKAQENNVKLSALMAIWHEDKNKIVRNDESIANFKKTDDLYGCFDNEDYVLQMKCTEQNKVLKSRREVIFTEIEKILCESGVAIPEMPMD